MKKIIKNKLYDTTTARRIAGDSYNGPMSDFRAWTETLYLKKSGEYFLHGEGGPMTQYAKRCSDNSWGWGEEIIPLSVAAAREWAEKHMEADDFQQAFDLPQEDTALVQITIHLPAHQVEALDAKKASTRQSRSVIISEALKEYFKK